MRRRDFLAAIGGAATWSQGVSAQPRKFPTIGILYAGHLSTLAGTAGAFRKGLAETGHLEWNVTFEFREAKNDLTLLSELARDLVRRQVDVIFVSGGGPSALVTKAATDSIPIVFSSSTDPIQMGLVADLAHPGGNVTGITDFGFALSAKRLELIRLLIPGASKIALLVPQGDPEATHALAAAREGARSLGIDIAVLQAGTPAEIDAAFATLASEGVDAVCVIPSVPFMDYRVQVVASAARHRIPTAYPFIQYAQIGGLMSYGSSLAERSHQAGVYVGLILNGRKPADLPVHRLMRFELAINMTTAKDLGLTAPASFLALTDKVIE